LPLSKALAGKSTLQGVLKMDDQLKDELKTNAQLATGTLTSFALIKSMTQSKTLTAMVCVGLLAFSGFIFFLVKMAN
jgi:hypothetical protein